MKKYILLLSAFVMLNAFNSCSDRELVLLPPDGDLIEEITTQDKLQQILNNAYLSIGNSNALGSNVLLYGDLLGDKIYNSPSRALFQLTYNYSYNQHENQFSFYRSMYETIVACNMIINNTTVPHSDELTELKGQAHILRGIAYYYLVSYYSPTPASGVNQEYGVPLVLESYDVTIQPARATVAQVYDQIINDLKYGITHAALATGGITTKKVYVGPDAARIVLARLYLTRRAAGDAELALQYATEATNNAPDGEVAPAAGASGAIKPGIQHTLTDYTRYWTNNNDAIYEDHGETIWELDLNNRNNAVMNIGTNGCLPVYYSPGDNTRRGILANATFYKSFDGTSDIRRAAGNTGLFSTAALTPDTPSGYWINKYPRLSSTGNFYRNIRIFRYSEAYLLRIEALRLTGQTALALTELNQFSWSRRGAVYTGTDLLNDILTEKSKEFFAEGQRFIDLKRYGLSVSRPSNCTTCEIPGNDHKMVLPMDQSAINSNPNLTQYPGY